MSQQIEHPGHLGDMFDGARTRGVRLASTPVLAERLDMVVANGCVVSSREVRREDVGVRDGKIVAVGDLVEADATERLDATGLLVLPGVLDTHVHPTYLDDPGQTSIAALCGGVTTVMHFAYAFGGQSLLGRVDALRDASQQSSLVDFGIHAAMFDAATQVAEVEAVARTGVRTFKLFLAYAAQGWMSDDAALIEVMQAVARVGGLLLVHCENGPAIDVLERAAATGALGSGASVLGASRPPALEAEAVHRVIMLGKAFACDVFIVHVTSREALEVVRNARAKRLRVAAETCPQYLTLTEREIERWGPLAKIGPPLRTASDREALWGGLRDRTLQTIGSDHVPKKTSADAATPLLEAGFGAPSIETMLSVVYDEGVARGRIPVTRLVEVMCENPARIFGLWPAKGTVEPGSDADLVLWDPSATGVISAETQHSNSGYTLFEGREVQGRHSATIRAGSVVARNGELTGVETSGRFLPTRGFDLRLDDPPLVG